MSSSTLHPPSAAQSLYDDGLHSIFKFLSLSEVALALQTCRPWLSAASKERNRSVRALLAPPHLRSLRRSALAHHISRVGSSDPFILTDLTHLAELPSLTSIEPLWLDAVALMQQTRSAEPKQPIWPQRLRTLEVCIKGGPIQLVLQDAFVPVRALVIEAVSKLRSLTALTLSLRTSATAASAALDLAPLVTGLPQLASLEITLWTATRAQLETIKLMSSLTELSINRSMWTAAQLQQLCEPPHQLVQLQQICLEQTVLTPVHMQALVQLPALSHLMPCCFEPDALPFLAQLPRLRHLRLGIGRVLYFRVAVKEAAEVFPHLRVCRSLTALELLDIKFTSAELSELASMLPTLQSLTFDWRQLRSVEDRALFDSDGFVFAELQPMSDLRTLTVVIQPPQFEQRRELILQHLLQLTAFNIKHA